MVQLMNAPKFRALIVDDHPEWRNTLRMSFSTLPNVEIIGAVPDGDSALVICQKTRPNMVIIDINIAGMSAFEIARELLKCYPNIWIIGVTNNLSDDDRQHAREAGIRSVIVKDMILDYLPPKLYYPLAI